MNTYTFGTGITVNLRPISIYQVNKVVEAARAHFIAEHGENEPPTYEAVLLGGDTETHYHDAKSVTEPKYADNEELQAAWMHHLDLKLRLTQLVGKTNVKAWAWYGIADDVPQTWIDEQKMFGIELPDDPAELKYQWIESIATGLDDAMNFASAVYKMRNPVEEAASAAEATFQHSLETQGRQDTGADSGAVDADNQQTGIDELAV